LSFDPAKTHFHCEYCLSDFTEQMLDDLLEKNQTAKAEEQREEREAFERELEEYYCPNCGATVACVGNTAATICHYCHTPVLHKGKLTGALKPDRIVPFALDREAATKAFLAFAKKHKFVPKAFYAPEQIDHMQGIYYPFWITDADVKAGMNADATRVRSWSTAKYRYVETSHYSVVREGEIHFEDLATSAITEVEREMLEGILPFPSDALIPFSMPYLSGFLTKKRDIEKEALATLAQERMAGYSERILRETISGYSSVRVRDTQVEIFRENWEYALMPLWVLTWRDKKGKAYTYAMNGHTGKVWGQLPIHYPKLIGWASALALVAGAVATLLGVVL
jgi:DNA-directed RNA polymerase subunit RPC12/RpoP